MKFLVNVNITRYNKAFYVTNLLFLRICNFNELIINVKIN